jgi:hypothetical protein
MFDYLSVVINRSQTQTVRVTWKFNREAILEMKGLQSPNRLSSARTVNEKDRQFKQLQYA